MLNKIKTKMSPHKASFTTRTRPCLRRKTERVLKKGGQGSGSFGSDDPFPHIDFQTSKAPGKIHRPTIIPVKPDRNLYKEAKENANLDQMVEIFEKSLPESKRGREKQISVDDELGNQTLEQM